MHYYYLVHIYILLDKFIAFTNSTLMLHTQTFFTCTKKLINLKEFYQSKLFHLLKLWNEKSSKIYWNLWLPWRTGSNDFACGMFPTLCSRSSKDAFIWCPIISSINNLKELIPVSVLRHSSRGSASWANKIMREYTSTVHGKDHSPQVAIKSYVLWTSRILNGWKRAA